MHAGLLQDFATSRIVRQLVILDVPSGRQPPPQLRVVVQEHAPGVDDEHGDGEVAQNLARGNRRMGGHARGPVYPDLYVAIDALAHILHAADDRLVACLNAAVRKSNTVRILTSRGASGLAVVEVLLMGGLALGGRRNAPGRMLAA